MLIIPMQQLLPQMALGKTTFYRPFPIKAIEKYLELLPSLIQAFRGAVKADAVVRNVTLVNVATEALIEGVSIATTAEVVLSTLPLIHAMAQSISLLKDRSFSWILFSIAATSKLRT